MIVWEFFICQWGVLFTRLINIRSNNSICKTFSTNYTISDLANIVSFSTVTDGKNILHITSIACLFVKIAWIWIQCLKLIITRIYE